MKRLLALASTFMGLGAVASSISPAIAQTEFPMYAAYVAQSGNAQIANFHVPDRDTTVSAYGGRLRRYDVHVAKMFEMTNYECNQRDRTWNRIVWRYRAGNGEIEMGAFDISCSLARDIVAAYGTGKPEATTVYYYRAKTTVNVPILAITGGKIDSWMRFTKNFRPEYPD